MRDVDDLLDDVYVSQERMTRDDLHRRAVAGNLPAEVIVALDALPEGEYAQDEVSEALAQISDVDASQATGVSALDLTDDDLLRELAELHRTRNDTLRHGSDQSLEEHDERLTELEAEYLRRFPEREVDPQRLREGARTRPAQIQALEDTEQVARAIDDEAPVPALAESGGSVDQQLGFREPSAAVGPGPRGRSVVQSAAEPVGREAQQVDRQRQQATGRPAGTGERGTSAADTRSVRTGAEQPWDPVDLAVAEGRDPTPRNVERARQKLNRDGSAAIERTVP
jgi:Family of unknown function (DUF6158)/Protein of unknown function (DUF2795)